MSLSPASRRRSYWSSSRDGELRNMGARELAQENVVLLVATIDAAIEQTLAPRLQFGLARHVFPRKRAVAYRRRRWPSHAPKGRSTMRPQSLTPLFAQTLAARYRSAARQAGRATGRATGGRSAVASAARRGRPAQCAGGEARQGGRDRDHHRHGRRAPRAAQSAPALSRVVQRRRPAGSASPTSTAARTISRSCCRPASGGS